MNFLAIDTASNNLSIAISVDNEIISYIDNIGNKHSELILPKIQELLDQANIKISDIDSIIYNQGPGSFTGLRVGLSVILGIAFGCDIKLIPIPSFMLHAYDYYKSNPKVSEVIVGLDARLNEVYLAGIRLPEFEYYIKPQLVKADQLDLYANATIKLGDAFVSDLSYPSAINLIGLANLAKFKAISYLECELFYLRDKVALNLDEQRRKS